MEGVFELKRIIGILMLIAIMFGVAACGNANQNGSNTSSSQSFYDKIKKSGEITIGTEGTYPPFTYHDENQQLTGFDVDIAREVAKRLGLKAKFVETKWDGMIAGLDSKRYDMVANEVGVTPERKKKYMFSDPYIASHAVLIVGKNNNDIQSFKDLKGKKVAQSITSNYLKIAEQYGAVNTPVDGFDESISLITSGRVDATVNDSLSYLDLMKRRSNIAIKKVDEQKDAAKCAFMFRKGSDVLVDKINQALADMKKDGTYLKISTQYFGTDVSK